MAHLELQTVRKSFGRTTALEGLDLTLAAGEFVSLLGPSGCGKTTTLRIIAGFETPDGGRVVVNGRDITRVPPDKRDMGMVFQSYSLFPNMTAIVNVGFGLRVRKEPTARRRARAAELLDLVGLTAHAERYPHELSGGQQQRVALARALAISPKVLLLDEPLSALDANVRVNLREEIRRIQRELGTTTLFVTHNQEEALAISDRVGVMSDGRLEQLAAPSRIYHEPATAFVARFVGVSNLLPGVAEGGHVRVHGRRIAAAAAAEQPRGTGVKLIVRPEEIRIRALDGSPAPDELTGVVVTRSFLGPVTRLSVRLEHGDGQVIRVDTPSRPFDEHAVGARVALRLEPAAPRVVRS
ncbi:ABC transporter ATP-binding protein [Kitasatospora sp. NBC_00240]|uniref:ABC transporter ATP-binding protein n=1 Tax=Kitasatospora sp. NBC_00240 TaxID=2903567 RepID=UPI00225BEF3D|nr:ABC transporter ATP-binding protein [Kitasatospora sp. NBC_00240]MCX5208353.1 ABC transporter ATP-binding protein [Kitasatospora sp. NBC_00240]